MTDHSLLMMALGKQLCVEVWALGLGFQKRKPDPLGFVVKMLNPIFKMFR